MRRAALFLGVVAGCGGPDTSFTTLTPILSVAPERLDLGEVGLPVVGTGEVYLSNTGLAKLQVDAVFEGGGGVYAIEPSTFEIPPDEQATLVVTFDPTTYRTYDGRIVLTSNDADHPTVYVPVTGKGADLPYPQIAIRDADERLTKTVELEFVTIGSSDALYFEIGNTGEGPLALGDITLDGPAEFAILGFTPSNTTLAPGDWSPMIVTYTPTDEVGDAATVHVPSDDPDEPDTTVTLLGNGGGAFEFPVAVFDCPPEVPLTGPEWVHFDGSASYDPQGLGPLFYQWTVTGRPEASDQGVPFDPDFLAESDLYVDVAGPWEVQLVVTSVLGAESEPAVCQFVARPEDDIHVELSWDTSSADLDLHLVEGGSALFDVPGDANYCNKAPDWGESGTDDDPRLDIDDRGGFGPENINVLTPAATDETYEVKVHYWQRNGDGPVQATVRVWLEGNEVYTGSKVLDYDQVWDVGTIEWPSVTWFVDPDPVYAAPTRGCVR